MAYYRRE